MCNILIIEDHIALRSVMVLSLTNKGSSVWEAENGPQAMKLINDSTIIFDIIISDLKLTKGNGKEVCKEAKNKRPNTKTLLFTGSTIDEKELLADPHIDNVLLKPAGLSELKATIIETLERR